MIKDFLQTGIIERYCLNDISEEERAMVNQMSLKYVEIEKEIKRFNKISTSNSSANSPLISKVKYRLMREIYQGSAKVNFNFLPLLNIGDRNIDLTLFLKETKLNPSKKFEGNMDMIPLASTVEIGNAAVWIKDDFGAEVHHNQNEFIYVVKGTCIMTLDGIDSYYKEGEMIFIPPFVTHSAKVTSKKPMFALVQRQLLAQA